MLNTDVLVITNTFGSRNENFELNINSKTANLFS